MKIVADSHIPFINEYFAGCGDLILKPGRSITASDVKDADVLIVRSITHVDASLLDNSKVKFVGSVTAGADHLDTKYLNEHGILYCIATGFNAPPVADYVVSTIACLQKKRILPATHIKAAIVGVGNVGRLVQQKLELLQCDLSLCDPIRAKQEKDFHSIPLHDLTDLDLISLHVPLSKTNDYPTYHFIDQAFLQKQKPGCVLLNASRGAVIDSQVLLQYGKELNWCFDVWENEPRINKDVLQQAVIATPHIAGYSVQSKLRGIDMIYRSLCENNIIQPTQRNIIEFPKQELSFAGDQHVWQDIVLGVFNPSIITSMMRTVILPSDDYGHYFDEMRNQFNYRYEFAYTSLQNVNVPPDQMQLLQQLGFTILSN